MSLSVVILAAGQGTRMRSSKPKVLHEISGKPMLFHAIDAAKELSDDITIVLYHKADMLKEKIEKSYDNISFHTQDALNYPGTGGAMRGVSTKYEKTLILNGDMPLITKESLAMLADSDADINMSVIKLDDPSGYGRVIIENGKVVKIVEEKDCKPDEKLVQTVNAGVYCVSKTVLEDYIPNIDNKNAQNEYYITDMVQMAVKDTKVVNPVIVKEEEFKGVNSKVDLSHAEIIMQNRIKKAHMINGVTMRLPETIYIDSRAKLEGECLLENGVTIIGKSYIKDSHIKAHSVVEDSTIIESDIGPMGRIRPLSHIEKTHIGNFVEVKKSTLTGVKAGHLSYIGDSQIDEGSNIGAGVITCNYDGKAKYKTIIGKNVFIGSDCQLVAPVNIADDVMIAAGSTVNKNVSKGSLAISRTPLKEIKGFFYKFFGKEDQCK